VGVPALGQGFGGSRRSAVNKGRAEAEGPTRMKERLRPERGAGGNRGEAAAPSERAWGWGPTRIK
jgi:hypothetical protein